MNTMDELMDLLTAAGKSEEDATNLLAAFLHEEAEGYALCVKRHDHNCFEETLQKMMEHGFKEREAEQMLADVIDEQRYCDVLAEELSGIYHSAKKMFS